MIRCPSCGGDARRTAHGPGRSYFCADCGQYTWSPEYGRNAERVQVVELARCAAYVLVQAAEARR